MIKWLARLFIVWVAIIFVASANEVIFYGWQQLVEAPHEAASATTTGHAAFPPVERESCTADNALYTRKKARLQTDESDDDLLTIGLRNRAAYPSYPSSLGQSSRSGVIYVLTENPIHLANSHEYFKFNMNDHWLFPSGVSLEQYFNSQASSSTTRRDFLSDFDKTRETGTTASTKHYMPSQTNRPESLSGPFNVGRKENLFSDAPITPGPLGNSVNHNQDGGRGTKRKRLNSWGDLLSLKTGVTLDENDTHHSYGTSDFLSTFHSEKSNRFPAEEHCIAMPQVNPQENQQCRCLFHLGINTPAYQNADASTAQVLSAGGRINHEMSSVAGQNCGNVLLSLKPPEQGENGKSWGADQGTTSSPRSQPQPTLRVEQNISVDWPRLTVPLLNQSPRCQHNIFESGNQGSSSEYPEHITQVSKMPQPHQPGTITTVGYNPSQIDGIKHYGRLKFNPDIFKGKGPNQLEKTTIVKLLNSIPRPYRGNSFLTEPQLVVACEFLRRRRSTLIPAPSIHKIGRFMGNIKRWYKYWNKHANIDFKILNHREEVSRCPFLLPLVLLYVEMIISIIPFKPELPLVEEFNYPQEMRNAIESYMELNRLMKTPPENGESTIWKEKHKSFKKSFSDAGSHPTTILWIFIEFWMKSHYTAVWNNVKQNDGLRVNKDVKAFFNAIFTDGIETLNEKLWYCLPHE